MTTLPHALVFTEGQRRTARLTARLAVACVAARLVGVKSTRQLFAAFQIAAHILGETWDLVEGLVTARAGLRYQDRAGSAVGLRVAPTKVSMSTRELLVANLVTDRREGSTSKRRLNDCLPAIATERFSGNDATLDAIAKMMNVVAPMDSAVERLSANCQANMRLGPKVPPTEVRTADNVAPALGACLVRPARLGTCELLTARSPARDSSLGLGTAAKLGNRHNTLLL